MKKYKPRGLFSEFYGVELGLHNIVIYQGLADKLIASAWGVGK